MKIRHGKPSPLEVKKKKNQNQNEIQEKLDLQSNPPKIFLG